MTSYIRACEGGKLSPKYHPTEPLQLRPVDREEGILEWGGEPRGKPSEDMPGEGWLVQEMNSSPWVLE